MHKETEEPRDKGVPITKAEVKRAISKLKFQNEKLTVRGIYKQLGRRGSFSTIQRFVDEIKLEESEELHKLNEKTFVTEELKAKGIELVMSVAESLMAVVRSKLEASNKATVALINEHAENIKTTDEEVDYLRGELEEMTARNKELEDAVAQLTREKTDLEILVKQERQRADTAEQGMQVVDQIQRKLTELMKAKEG